MLFHSSRKFTDNNALLINLNGNEIEQLDKSKYLGIMLDFSLNFSSHVSMISGKIKQRTALLWKLRHIIPEDLAFELYRSLIEPIFLYCSYIYEGCSVTEANKLQVLHNNALRAVKSVGKRYSATRLHSELEVEWLSTMRMRACCVEAYKYIHGIGPPEICDLFQRQNPVRSLRSENQILLPMQITRTKWAESDCIVRAKKYWRSLSEETQHAPSLETFKHRLKRETAIFRKEEIT